MEIPDNFYRTSIKALILDKNRKFLLCKEDNGYWDLPGGGIDFGETSEETLKREIFEEMGLVVTEIDNKPEYFFTFKNHKNIWSANVIFKIKVKNLRIKKSNECVEIKFFNKEEVLKENVFPNIIKFVEMFEEDEKNIIII